MNQSDRVNYTEKLIEYRKMWSVPFKGYFVAKIDPEVYTIVISFDIIDVLLLIHHR